MIEFTPDSVRFHRHDLAYPASYPGETIDVNLQFYPIKYSSDGSITIDVAQFVVFKTEAGTLILRGENIEIEILRLPPPQANPPPGGRGAAPRSLKYLHAEKNDEKIRQTFGGTEINA